MAYSGDIIPRTADRAPTPIYRRVPPLPGERRELLLGYSGAALERLLGRPEGRATIGWDEAVADLAARFGDVDGILGEPALAEVEAETRSRLRDILGRDPAGRQWSVDSVLARFCYLACRLLQPEVVVETGVAYGASSAFVLKALRENGRGMLYSVDLPPLARGSRRFWAGLVEDGLDERWSLRRGPSRRVLPGLFDEVGPVGLFLHDSLHTRWNMRREFGLAWPRLKTGGMLVADDVERNREFEALRRLSPAYSRTVSDVEWEPLSGACAPVEFGVAIK